MKLTPITNPVALRLDTTVGTRIFAGDTMIYGDTGWRSIIDPSNFPTMTEGRILAKRTAGGVMISVDAAKFNQTGSIALPRLGLAFRPKFRLRTNWYADLAGAAGGTVNISSAGYFNLYNSILDQEVYMDATFDTDNAWPSSLDGLPI